MTVEQFVARRREPWRRLERITQTIRRDGPAALDQPDLADYGRLYLAAAGDLAYARAHLPNPELIAWLGRLVGGAYGCLYAGRRRSLALLLAAVAGYPARWRASAPFLAVAAAILFGAAGLGLLVVLLDPAQAVYLMPPLVREAVALPPGGAVPTGELVALSGYVLADQLSAALIAFALGLLGGLGTLATLVQHGLQLGGLAGLALEASPAAFGALAALVLPSGVLGLAALVTCAAAGLKLGWAVLHGGRTSRAEALAAAGREALALLLGTLPWLAGAVLTEALVTPLGLPPAAGLAVALLTASLLIGYLGSGRRQP